MAIVLTPLRHYSIVLTIPLGVLVYLAALFATGDRTLLQLQLLDAPTVAPADAVEAD
jgi:hypothetical protein